MLDIIVELSRHEDAQDEQAVARLRERRERERSGRLAAFRAAGPGLVDRALERAAESE